MKKIKYYALILSSLFLLFISAHSLFRSNYMLVTISALSGIFLLVKSDEYLEDENKNEQKGA